MSRLVDPGARDAVGITLAELAVRVRRPTTRLQVRDPRDWLIDGLAVEHDGLLQPTELTVGAGAWLASSPR